MNTSEYALQMCRPVTLQVNTLADGQLRTGWPHRLPPGESAGEGRRRGEEGAGGGTGAKRVGGGGIGGGELWVREERRGLCAEGPEPRASHPEDLCSLAGWILRRQTERKRESGRKRKEKKKKRRGKGRKKYMGEGENEREG